MQSCERVKRRGRRREQRSRKNGEKGNRKRGRMPYTIRIYKPRETFRMHIRVERWPTVDFRRGRELTFALPLCANSHKDSLSLPSPLFVLPPPSSPRPRRTTVCFLREFQSPDFVNVRVHRQFNFFLLNLHPFEQRDSRGNSERGRDGVFFVLDSDSLNHV